MYPAALHNTPTHTVGWSQVLAKCLREKRPQVSRSTTTNSDKSTIKDLEQVCPKQDHDFRLTF